ncbi:MAG: hypothetical protein IPO81_27510 [Kouleothrix sp.]|nr:hypothetical protein [Kouleothrix sp.]
MARIKQRRRSGSRAQIAPGGRAAVWWRLLPNVRPVAALVIRLRVVQGQLAQALGWARERGCRPGTSSYLREFEHITLARILIARAKIDASSHSLREAIGLLARLLEAAEAGERIGRVIEILVLQALACQVRGDLPPLCAAGALPRLAERRAISSRLWTKARP